MNFNNIFGGLFISSPDSNTVITSTTANNLSIIATDGTITSIPVDTSSNLSTSYGGQYTYTIGSPIQYYEPEFKEGEELIVLNGYIRRKSDVVQEKITDLFDLNKET